MRRVARFLGLFVLGMVVGITLQMGVFDDHAVLLSALQATADSTRAAPRRDSAKPVVATLMPDGQWWQYDSRGPRVSEIPREGDVLRVPSIAEVDLVFRHNLTAMMHITAPAGMVSEGALITIELQGTAHPSIPYLWDRVYKRSLGVSLPFKASGHYDVCRFEWTDGAWGAIMCIESPASLVPLYRRLD